MATDTPEIESSVPKSDLKEPLGVEPCDGCHIPPAGCKGLADCRPCDTNWQAGYNAGVASAVQAVELEPEYPGAAPPKLCAVLDQAIQDKDRDLLLHAMRETVRLTKQCIIDRITNP